MAAESRRWAYARLGSKPGIRPAALQLIAEAAAMRAVADTYLLAVGAQSAAALGWNLARACARKRKQVPDPDMPTAQQQPNLAGRGSAPEEIPCEDADLFAQAAHAEQSAQMRVVDEEGSVFSFPAELD